MTATNLVDTAIALAELAISKKLYCFSERRWSGSPAWYQPIRLENDQVVMLWGDCGREDREGDVIKVTLAEFAEKWAGESGGGLYRRVGFWDFERYGNPANEDIKWCHQNPHSAGEELYRLRAQVEELKRLLGDATTVY